MYYSTIIERYCNYAILYCNKVYEVDKCYQQYSFISNKVQQYDLLKLVQRVQKEQYTIAL